MPDLDPNDSLALQYMILGVASTMNIITILYSSFKCAYLTQSNWATIAPIFAVCLISPSIIASAFTLSAPQTQIVNGNTDDSVNTYFLTISRINNVFLLLFGICVVGAEHHAIQSLHPTLGYPKYYDYIGYAAAAVMHIFFLAFTQVDFLRTWKTVAQFIYAMVIYVSWTACIHLVIRKLFGGTKSADQPAQGTLATARKRELGPRTSITVANRIYRIQVAICALGVVALALAAYFNSKLPNIAMVCLRFGTIVIVSYSGVVLITIHEIIPLQLQHTSGSFSGILSASRGLSGLDPFDRAAPIEQTLRRGRRSAEIVAACRICSSDLLIR
ncbi:uncharacterized protein BJ171DRAFT_501785 [Polychytrium aggregatum]|uniref:uncharacterized protein n=1 Tax=Polychytrium aggregatum TaxID=110093 RepID=UPI0022FE2A4A|nr:uncharacterized protein BJ171DRAFT_501785 [Polychytrium aggregatum]KAI9205328.1 hypothetical protein BJ171DRAFT_501785 [Polychytrium aggregatum]